MPTLRALAIKFPKDATSPDKEIRRSVSISAFPQPPQSPTRLTSVSQIDCTMAGPRRGSSPQIGTASTTSRITPPSSKRKTSTIAGHVPVARYSTARSTSLLNGTGEGKSIPNAVRKRVSDGVASLTSPSHSRSSSGQDSCSTSATTFEEMDETTRRGREDAKSPLSATPSVREGKESKQNVTVSVRVRPDVTGDKTGKADGEWMVDGRRSLVAYKGREGGDYFYDNVFAAHDKNQKVYDASAKRLVRRVMEGYHGTVFAYGMTGTGKTFSMQGTATQPGVIPQAITDIFAYIRETPSREFLLRVSYLEIYNEKIHDLLSTPAATGVGPGAAQPEEIKLREDSKRGVYASPLKEEIVQSPTQLLRVIARGDHSRRTRSTQFNAQSSRSHAVVQIVVESRERASPGGSKSENRRAVTVHGGVRVSTLSMIDLAGSERAADNKERRTEGAHINKSLLTLGTVIARLSSDKDKDGHPTDKDGKHLPYRDSKLTRLLQPALSGNSLVSILCTIQIGCAGSVATATGHTAETLNTLKFAARAKNNIVSHAKRSEEVMGNGADAGAYKGLLERYRLEIQSLKNQLAEQPQTRDKPEKKEEEKVEDEVEKQAELRHEEQMLEMQLARTALKERIEHLNRLILSSKSSGVNTKSSIAQPTIKSSNNSLRSATRSLRSSASHSTLNGREPAANRTVSLGSVTTVNGGSPDESFSPQASFHMEPDDLDEESTGEYGDGTATANAQIRALQADVADKNRYISTLEKRLLQARRSSQSRTSLAFSCGGRSPSALGGIDADRASILLQEKDAEIADLRAELDDKDRMVNALRSAARKREMAGIATSEPVSPEAKRGMDGGGVGEVKSLNLDRVLARRRTEEQPSTAGSNESSPLVGTADDATASPLTNGHPSLSSNLNQRRSGAKPSPPPPADLPLPPHPPPPSAAGPQPPSTMATSGPSSDRPSHHPLSSMTAAKPSPPPSHPSPHRTLKGKPAVNDLSIRILDEMIQDRVESGHRAKGSGGSVGAAAGAGVGAAAISSVPTNRHQTGGGGSLQHQRGGNAEGTGESGGSRDGAATGPGMGQLIKGLRGGSMLVEEE